MGSEPNTQPIELGEAIDRAIVVAYLCGRRAHGTVEDARAVRSILGDKGGARTRETERAAAESSGEHWTETFDIIYETLRRCLAPTQLEPFMSAQVDFVRAWPAQDASAPNRPADPVSRSVAYRLLEDLHSGRRKPTLAEAIQAADRMSHKGRQNRVDPRPHTEMYSIVYAATELHRRLRFVLGGVIKDELVAKSLPLEQAPDLALRSFDLDIPRGIGARGGMFAADMVASGMREQFRLPAAGKGAITWSQLAACLKELLENDSPRWWVGKTAYHVQSTAERFAARSGIEILEGNRYGVREEIEAEYARALAHIEQRAGPITT